MTSDLHIVRSARTKKCIRVSEHLNTEIQSYTKYASENRMGICSFWKTSYTRGGDRRKACLVLSEELYS